MKMVDRKMHVFLTRADPKHPLRILVQVPGLDTKGIEKNCWTLLGMKFEIQTPFTEPAVQIKDDKRLGKVIEVSFPVSPTHPSAAPTLILSPTKIE